MVVLASVEGCNVRGLCKGLTPAGTEGGAGWSVMASVDASWDIGADS